MSAEHFLIVWNLKGDVAFQVVYLTGNFIEILWNPFDETLLAARNGKVYGRLLTITIENHLN